jgi:predicted flap endonuclease-1-like 5' DNA nuclease
MQIWIYLLAAMVLGALIAYLLGICNCNKDDLQEQLDAATAERDELALRLAGRPANASAKDSARVKSLEAELKAANAKLAAGGVTGAALGFAAGNGNDEALIARNRFLETRVKYLEEGFSPPNNVIDNSNFVTSAAGSMNAEALEAAVLAAGAGTKPTPSKTKDKPDDLLLIDGVGPKNNQWLKKQGIYYFWQIATMNVDELAWLSNNLPNFGSRVYRENWVAQCANLAKGLPAR